ncbi:MAG: serine/threonine-protein kinase, partial [Dongiaceae bacterium]
MADRRHPDDDLTVGPSAKTVRPQTTAPGGQSSTIAPGQLLGHTYRIEALLARGGMGEVYRARHAELNTEHAIKIILPELAGNTRIVDLFRREASVLRTIRHDAIVAYDGVFRDENGRLYLVMEFVDGPSLSKLFKQGALRPAQVRELRDRLADGLAAAHEKGVTHRDLSPDNVILPGGELTKAKIIDFGISKMADPTAKTIVGDDFAGKYSYVSPEQVGLYGGKVDPRSDIYSLGLVLAAAATGKPLDMGSSPISVVEARRAVPKLERVPAELRPELTAMLQPDPADRPQSLRDLLREPARPARRAESAQRPGRSTATTTAWDAKSAGRGIRMAVVGGALVLLLAVGGGVGYWLLAPTPPGPQPPDKIALLRTAADEALKGFQCAELSARISQLGDID